MRSGRALLVVDVQNDFCPGGSLAVPGGDKIIPAINRYIRIFARAGLPVFASRDRHPKKTAHFRQFGGVWPKHCVENTKGAALHPRLKLPCQAILLYKGMDPAKDSYSAFQAQDANGMGLFRLLKCLRVKELYVCGLATDYCVKSSVIDALKKGFRVKLFTDAIKGVDLRPGDSGRAVAKMAGLGARKITLKDMEG